MRTVILNLTRFGDLLQSQAVIHALRHKGHEVGLICLQNFMEAARLLDGVSFVAALPGGGFLADLDAGWPRALARLHDWRETVRRDFGPDDVLNLTSTTSARLLAGLLAHDTPTGGLPHGFALDDHGFGIAGSAWTAFFEASTRKRGCSPFNLVDVFLRASALQGPARYALASPEDHLLHAAGQRLHELSAPFAVQREVAGYVALQLGASDPRRQWPTPFFAAIGRKLFDQFGLLPVLLGAEHERALAGAYLCEGAPGLNLAGQTGLTELAAVLKHTRLLITNDTGTMHLAAGLDIDCLAVFLATAQPWDTGPYREGCCSLEPAMLCHPCGFDAQCPSRNRCLEHIRPETVWPLVQGYLSGNGWTCPPETRAQARVWRAGRDAWSYMDLVSLSGHDTEDRTVWIRVQRHIYRQLLDVIDKTGTAPIELPKTLTAGLSPELRTQNGTVLEQADGLLLLLQEQCRLTLMRPTDRLKRQILTTCQRLGMLFDEHDSFNALSRLWQTLSQERGSDMSSLLTFTDQLRIALDAWNSSLKS